MCEVQQAGFTLIAEEQTVTMVKNDYSALVIVILTEEGNSLGQTFFILYQRRLPGETGKQREKITDYSCN